jgi:hypothetical protein
MTRYYIRRLVQDQVVNLGLAATPLTGTDTQNSRMIDEVIDLDALTPTKAAEVDLLVRLHQSFSRLGLGHRSHVQHLESKLFGLLGLVYKPETIPAAPELTALRPPHSQASITQAEALAYLNQVSQVAKKYLGDLIARNYWRSTRPSSNWFVDYEVSTKAELIYRGGDHGFLKDEQLAQLQAWLNAFIHQCQRVLPKFTAMLAKSQVALESSGLMIASLQ